MDSNDPDLWLECTSPFSATDLTTGVHTFEVRASGLAEAAAGIPARYTWTVGDPANCDDANITLAPVADVFVDELLSFENMVILPQLSVRADELPGNAARSLLRFNIANDAPNCALESATLRLYADSHSDGRTLEVLRLAAPWAENIVTWDNQPATIGTPVTTASGQGFREWDVTEQVRQMLAGTIPNHG